MPAPAPASRRRRSGRAVAMGGRQRAGSWDLRVVLSLLSQCPFTPIPHGATRSARLSSAIAGIRAHILVLGHMGLLACGRFTSNVTTPGAEEGCKIANLGTIRSGCQYPSMPGEVVAGPTLV